MCDSLNKVTLIDLCICTHGPELLVVFGKVVEPLGGEFSWKKSLNGGGGAF